jgi:hypothetical protein
MASIVRQNGVRLRKDLAQTEPRGFTMAVAAELPQQPFKSVDRFHNVSSQKLRG